LPLHFVSTSGHPKERRRNIRKVDIVQKPEQGANEKRKEKKSFSEYEATSQYKKDKNDNKKGSYVI